MYLNIPSMVKSKLEEENPTLLADLEKTGALEDFLTERQEMWAEIVQAASSKAMWENAKAKRTGWEAYQYLEMQMKVAQELALETALEIPQDETLRMSTLEDSILPEA
jgi:hypothetical protein